MTTTLPRVLPEAVVFDNDGLFLDTEEAWSRAERVLFERHGSEFTMEHKRDIIGSSHNVAAGKLERMLGLPGRGLELMAELHDLVMEEVLHDIPPRPGAVDLASAVRAAGIPVGLASNSPRAFLDRTLATSGTAHLFDLTIAGDEVARPNPEPAIYLAACERLGAAPERCVALEDSPAGVAAARAAGMFVVGVPYLDDIQVRADLVVRSLADPEVHAACGLREAA